jgi:hypothetical protein
LVVVAVALTMETTPETQVVPVAVALVLLQVVLVQQAKDLLAQPVAVEPVVAVAVQELQQQLQARTVALVPTLTQRGYLQLVLVSVVITQVAVVVAL